MYFHGLSIPFRTPSEHTLFLANENTSPNTHKNFLTPLNTQNTLHQQQISTEIDSKTYIYLQITSDHALNIPKVMENYLAEKKDPNIIQKCPNQPQINQETWRSSERRKKRSNPKSKFEKYLSNGFRR